MRKRWLTGIIVLLVGGLVLGLAFPALVYVPLGWFKHEAFFAGKPTSYWIRALKHEGFLGHAPPAGDTGKVLREGGSAAVPVLCQIAENPDDTLRTDALLALCLIGPEAKEAAPVLASTVRTDASSSRFLLASDALGKTDSRAAGETLAAVLRDKKDAGRRAWALAALLKLAPEGHEALPILNEMLNDTKDDARLRVQAIEVLWRLKQLAEPLAVVLCEFASDEKCEAGVQALAVLGDMGPAAKAALPALLKLLDKPTLATTGRKWGPAHRAAVIRTLGQIGPDAAAAVPRLVAILQSKTYPLHSEVIQALAHMGPAAKEALPTLLAALTGKEAASWASLTLLASRPPSSLAILPLVQVVQSSGRAREDLTHKAIRTAIQRIDPKGAGPAGVLTGVNTR
jgi:HEAT repeat protein